MLGGGFFNSRLATRIRQKEGISYGVGSQLYADAQDKSGGFMIYAIYAPENRDRLEAAYKEVPTTPSFEEIEEINTKEPFLFRALFLKRC